MRIRHAGPVGSVLVLLLISGLGCEPEQTADPAQAAAPPQTEHEKTLYSLGARMGRVLEQFSLSESEWAWVEQGVEDRTLGRRSVVDPEDFGAQIQAFIEERTSPPDDDVGTPASVDPAAVEAFLAEQATVDGAVTYDSGLIMNEIVAGEGASPSPTDTVVVHYHGTLQDGTVFDSSVDRGQKARFPLNRVIPCWTEALGKMSVGGKSRLVCPPQTAYGARGSGKIPPNAPIVFEVELFEVAN